MNSRAIGCDVGTFFFQTAEQVGAAAEDIQLKTIRNCFVELTKTDDINQVLKNNNFQYVEDDKSVYVIGEDAIRFARMLPGKVELRRPLQNGVLNAGEEMKMQVLNEIIRSTVGKSPDRKSVVATCVSSPPVDGSQTNTFHEKRLRGMFETHGWQVQVVEEGLAVILAENPASTDAEGNRLPYTGIGVSFGAGRVNIVVAYKGVVAAGMSASRSGDWIDRECATALSLPISTITHHKETKLDFDNLNLDDDKDFALEAYYKDAVRWNMSQFAAQFKKQKGSGSECPLDIVVAGGTSMPKGFIGMFTGVVRSLDDIPFEIKDIRHAKDPRNTVCVGLMRRAINAQKELAKKDSVEEILLQSTDRRKV